MLRKIFIALGSLAMLAATLAVPKAPQALAQADLGLSLITEFRVPDSTDVKFPHVTAFSNQVYVSGNANRASAFVWAKEVTAIGFPGPTEVGAAGGQPDFSSTSIARGPDGSIYVAWVNQPSRTIYLRQRNPAGTWGATRTVDRDSSFPVAPEVGVSSTGQIFVAWRIPDAQARFSRSSDGGVTWTSATTVSDAVAFSSQIGLSGGPNGSMGLTFTAGEADSLQIFVGLWNGASFAVTRITTLGADYADSSITLAPNGRIYAAWRGVDSSGGNSGVFYAERTADGNWPRVRLASGKVSGTVNVHADEDSSLHFAWIAMPSGSNRPNYAFKPADGPIRGPLASSSGTIFNARSFASVFNSAYNHVVLEEFSGTHVYTRYVLFRASASTFGGSPVIENGATRVGVGIGNTVQVNFPNVGGAPDQLRYAWNRAPTDTDAWQTYSTTVRLAVPTSIISSTMCTDSVLYTQLRNTTTSQLETTVQSDTIQIDGIVSAGVQVDNLFNHTTGSVAELSNVQGAPGGDAAYTRVPLVYLAVTPQGDCSGLATLSVGSTPTTIENSYALTPTGFQGVVPLPNLINLTPGKVPFSVRITDGVGNVQAYPFDVILDEDKPVLDLLNPGTLTVTANLFSDVLQHLTFTNPKVSDGTYVASDPDPNRHFWGLWIANSPDAVANPVAAGLKWTVVKAPASVAVPGTAAGSTDYTVTIKNWSLAAGLSRTQMTPGDYFIYIRFLDAAGNPTDAYLETRIAFSQMNLAKTYLPLVVR